MSLRPDVASAARLSSAFQLREVTFALIEGRLLPEGRLDEKQNVLDWDLALVRVQWVVEGHELRVVVPIRIAITCNALPLAALFTVLRAEYQLREGTEMPSADDIDHFAGITPFMHVWPYARAEVQALTAKLAIPPLTLPVILSGHVPEKVVVVRAAAAKVRKSGDAPTARIAAGPPATKKRVSKRKS